MDENEAIDPESADVFKVRTCDDCGGAVVERYMTKSVAPPCDLLKAIGHDDKREPQEPTDLIDIPHHLLPWLIERLQEIAKETP